MRSWNWPRSENDYITINFLQWFLTEQLEEVSSMDNLLKIVQRGADNLLQVEEYLARVGSEDDGGSGEASTGSVADGRRSARAGNEAATAFFLRQALKGGLAPGEFLEGHGGGAHDLGIVGHILEHSAFRGDLDAMANLEMAGESALSRDENVIAQLGGAGDADLRDEQAMLPDLHVVPDLDQIVDLGPLAYHGFAQGRPIDRGPGADLDVVLDPDDADLRDLVMLALVHGKAVAIGADDDARVNDAAPANARAIVNDDIGINDRIVAERGAGFDRDPLENRDVSSR